MLGSDHGHARQLTTLGAVEVVGSGKGGKKVVQPKVVEVPTIIEYQPVKVRQKVWKMCVHARRAQAAAVPTAITAAAADRRQQGGQQSCRSCHHCHRQQQPSCSLSAEAVADELMTG
jgi:hypothetical protein